MGRKVINLLFHAVCVFCLLAVFSQAFFILYERNDSRGLRTPIFQIDANAKDDVPTIPEPVEATRIIKMLKDKVSQSSVIVLYQPDNTFSNQTTIYIAGKPEDFRSSHVRSGRFFNDDELNARSRVLIAFADSWLDVFFYRENRELYNATGNYTVIGVLETDDVLQRDGYDSLAPLGTNDTFNGTWFISSNDEKFVQQFSNALRDIDLIVKITPIVPLGLNIASITLLLSDKFFVVYLLGFIASLVNLFFYYSQCLRREKKWNRIRYMVGARKATHYLYAIKQYLSIGVVGALFGSLLQLLFWLTIFHSSKAMVSIVFWYPAFICGAILIFWTLYSITYISSDFLDKKRS